MAAFSLPPPAALSGARPYPPELLAPLSAVLLPTPSFILQLALPLCSPHPLAAPSPSSLLTYAQPPPTLLVHAPPIPSHLCCAPDASPTPHLPQSSPALSCLALLIGLTAARSQHPRPHLSLSQGPQDCKFISERQFDSRSVTRVL